MGTERDELPRGHATELVRALAEHPFTVGLDHDQVEVLAGLAGQVAVPAGGMVFRHGTPAEALYLLTAGDVALEMPRPGRPPIILQTLHEGDGLGWSWLYPPYTWHLDAHVVSDVEALALDAARLRAVLVEHPALGVVVAMRIGALVVERLHHARDQLVSVQQP